MNPSDPSERLERMKQVLADSYPRVSGQHGREPLPESVRVALGGQVRSAPDKVPFFEKLFSLLRGPQLAAVAVTAMLVIAAVILTRPPSGVETGGSKGQDFRSGGGTAGLPSLVVLHQLGAAQTEALESSGYFRPEQLAVVPAGDDLAAFLESNKRPNLLLVDGATGEITAPFAGDTGPAAISFAGDETDLAPRILDLLAELPEPADEP
ncbi:hypothetical protein [Luteolibacter marinus]|uniref:hypothetical protein n=1 Tax=Luteolibacter marinus TaxID=2776705 RepID=UPI0018689851|nr:hypothetical protein [Luteolibacter marinus]